jgi:hypothetical protein
MPSTRHRDGRAPNGTTTDKRLLGRPRRRQSWIAVFLREHRVSRMVAIRLTLLPDRRALRG